SSECCASASDRGSAVTRAVTTWWCSGGTSTSTPSWCTKRTPSSRCCSGRSRPAGRVGPLPARWSTSSYAPAAPSATAAPPARNPRRVSFTVRSPSGPAGRLDQNERVQLALQVPHELLVVERGRKVLGERVERASVVPGERHVPLVRALIDGEERCVDPVQTDVPARVVEARDRVAVPRAR